MLSFAWWLSLLVGFLSLSEEILWVRVVGFGYDTLPPAFSMVLANYLVGIALGAMVGKRLCSGTRNLYAVAAVVLVIAACFDVMIPKLVAGIDPSAVTHTRVLAVMIVATAGLKSILFPIAHHLGAFASGSGTGRSVSRVYFGNIIGSTLGPLLTGFIALEYLTVDECFVLVGVVCLAAAGACAAKADSLRLAPVPVALIVASGFLVLPRQPAEHGVLGAFAHQQGGLPITHMIGNRHGVIHTIWSPQGDLVYGTNVYDGIAAANVELNTNRLDRVYLLGLLHERPKRVLVVGLATGAWTRAVQGFPGVERIDIVEINPGYLELIRAYPDVAPVLTDPRVHVHVDDGRRWLKRNPDARFDLIVQNTTYHWRANSTNLLSREYFTEVRTHLAPGGIVTFNTTGSYDVLHTAGVAFAHAYRYGNFVYASDHPLEPDYERLKAIRRPDGTPFETHAGPPESVSVLLSRARMEPVDRFIELRGVADRVAVITDDNLLIEYRHGKRFGSGVLRALLPAEPEHFELGDPVLVSNEPVLPPVSAR